MDTYLRRCWAQVHLDALEYNIRSIRSMVGEEAQVMAVVKANAYGHGDGQVARCLQQLGISWFGVSNIDEAISLRKFGIVGNILILGITPLDCCYLLAEYDIVQTVYSSEYACALNGCAVQLGVTIRSHLAVDTGMGRIGFVHHDVLDAVEEILALRKLRNLEIEGMFTHYAVADEMSEESLAYTDCQSKAFDGLAERLEAKGMHLPVLHTKNSAAISNLSGAEYQLVRAGIILYGITPSEEVAKYDLKPVMELKSVVSMVKTIPAGTSVSYGRRFISEREMKVATVPIGYADGFFRCFSNRGDLLVRGKRAKILGSVCMDQLMIDVTEIPGVEMGDTVTVFGQDGEESLSVYDWAKLANTIPYEILCAVGHRVPRVYDWNGKTVGTTNYLYR